MPQFTYRAKKGPNDILTGVMEAQTTEEAIDKLGDLGLLPISLEETKALSAEGEPRQAKTPLWRREISAVSASSQFLGRIKSSEITIFSRQLASLLKSGVPILRAFGVILDQTENVRFKNFLIRATDQIKDGKPFSSVLSEYPKLFPPVYVAMIRTGEDSGTLQEALMRMAIYRQKQEEILSHVRAAIAYPALMGITGIGTVVFMLAFVVPRLSALFANMGEHLPLPTRLLIAFSHNLHQTWFLALLAFLVFSVIFLLKFKARQAKRWWSRLSLKIPFVKVFVLKSELARFSRTLDLLIKSGVPILRAIDITAPVLNNLILREEFNKTQKELAGGGSLGESLRRSKHFPLFMTNLISVGEESGRLDEAMDEIAGFYERETEEAVKVLTSLLEPLMILGMGLVVGFIVIAMLLPMFELSLAVK